MKKYTDVIPAEWGVMAYVSEPVLNIDTLTLKLSVWLANVDYGPTDYEVLNKGIPLEIKVTSVGQEILDDPTLVMKDHPLFKVAGWQPPTYPHYFDSATKDIVDARSIEIMWESVKIDRAKRLLATDWTQLPDVPLATKEAWAVYRQALRDITEQPDPFNITWPTLPQ